MCLYIRVNFFDIGARRLFYFFRNFEKLIRASVCVGIVQLHSGPEYITAQVRPIYSLFPPALEFLQDICMIYTPGRYIHCRRGSSGIWNIKFQGISSCITRYLRYISFETTRQRLYIFEKRKSIYALLNRNPKSPRTMYAYIHTRRS